MRNRWRPASRPPWKASGTEPWAWHKDGKEAVKYASELRPDLIIMDIRLPGIDRLQAARSILSERPVPIVILTAYADADLIRSAAEAGAMAYLVKPVGQKQLCAAIEVARARFEEFSNLRREAETLKEALATRKLVERAKGILMERLKLSEAEAFRRMQQQARSARTSLKELAAKIIEGEDLFETIGRQPPRTHQPHR